MEDGNSDKIECPLLPHYVYILLNPLDGNKPFYVGKGMGRRAQAHFNDLERELRKEQFENSLDSGEFNKKTRILHDIKSSGMTPLELVVARFETEDEAFAVETTLIHFVYGRDSLANIAGGHGWRNFRERQEFDEIVRTAKSAADIPPRPGIDIPVVRYVRDGAFPNSKREKLALASAYEWCEDLKRNLDEHSFNWRDYTGRDDRRYDPGESNGLLGAIVRIGGIDFNVDFTAAKKMKIGVLGTASTRLPASTELLQRVQTRLGISIGEAKIPFRDGAWKYKTIEGEPRYSTFAGLMARLTEFRDAMTDADFA
ncbi:hypothetical protein WBP06_18370 (plasmid) [Novosphingobium sp. BL-8H]|uniref:LEM-3-like GIY-YIG domain-containing protein n=1 Tax=Novosphingobium sp. BL-8H TaxID=3127640 RepID=UPI003757ABC4